MALVDKEKRNEYARQWAAANPQKRDPDKRRAWKRAAYNRVKDDPAFREHQRARGREWWEKNKEQQALRRKAELEANPEKRRAQREKRRQKRAENPERYNAYQVAYRAKNPERVKKSARDRAAARREAQPAYTAFCSARVRARSMKVAFDLTREWANTHWTGRCSMTGIEFAKGSGRPTAFSASIDRIEPSFGYTKDNCRFVLWALNRFKGPDTDETMLMIARSLVAKASAP